MSFVNSAWRLALGCVAALAMAAPAAAQATHDGDYAGVLKAPGGRTLHLVLHVKTTGGETGAELDSVDQGVTIPASAYKLEKDQVSILFMAVMGELKGTFSADGNTLTGSWTQGLSMPLTLTKTAATKP